MICDAIQAPPAALVTGVSVLFARRDSIYKALCADVWDEARDARNWPGGNRVVTHPPCRLWGALRAFSGANEDERALGPWAVAQVRRWGGVLEHPARSLLWIACGMPPPGDCERDSFGGYTIAAPQWWFGHRAEKWTWLYICGVEPAALPSIPFALGEASHVIAQSRRRQRL